MYNWEKINVVNDNNVDFYIDEDKRIKVNIPTSSTGYISIFNGTAEKKIISSISSTANVIARFVTCKSGAMFDFLISNVSVNYYVIVGTATNQITNASEKVIFGQYSSTTSGYYAYLLSSDNKSQIGSISEGQLFPKESLSAKITTATKIYAKHSECVMDNALYMLNSELTSLSNCSISFKGKNYYMMSRYMLED